MVPARNIYTVSYAEDDLVAKLVYKDVQKQDDLAEGEYATDGYQMLNLRLGKTYSCLLYTSPSPRDRTRSRMPSSA